MYVLQMVDGVLGRACSSAELLIDGQLSLSNEQEKMILSIQLAEHACVLNYVN